MGARSLARCCGLALRPSSEEFRYRVGLGDKDLHGPNWDCAAVGEVLLRCGNEVGVCYARAGMSPLRAGGGRLDR
jgi:hypothetical protein